MLLKKSKLLPGKTIQIGGSKSISNRLLILQKLYGQTETENFSNSQDSELMQKALNSSESLIDIHHAGTAMRFLTSYFAIQEGRTVTLTGSERMKERPIGYLVDALKALGADIEYLENEGFPPLRITGKKLEKNFVWIPANISSQFITSLLLIAAKLENGLTIELEGEITSRPYLEMTLEMLSEFGIENSFTGNTVRVQHFGEKPSIIKYTVESDWSSASYFYSLAAIGREKINLKSFRQHSLQGDSAITEIYERFFGIQTEFLENSEIALVPQKNFEFPEKICLNMNSCPDIAQTLCVTAAVLKIPFEVTGLATLRVKETDRLSALKNELSKIGCVTEITDDSIKSEQFIDPENAISIATYNDHRMAMSYAPCCLVMPVTIEHPEVVGKSFPDFWDKMNEILHEE